MRTIDYYIDLAREKQGFKSDNQLGKALNFAGSGISNWRVKKAFPSDEKMIELARLAGVNDLVALMDLQIWKAENDDTRAAYKQILKRISVVFIAALILFPAKDAFAKVNGKYSHNSALLYIMGNNIQGQDEGGFIYLSQ